jgi:hypothetical protein
MIEIYRINTMFLVDYYGYTSFNQMFDHSFYFEMNTPALAGLHILTYGVKNLTLAVL